MQIHKIIAPALIVLVGLTGLSHAQDLEPRRWSQLPTGLNFIGVGLAYSEGDIFIDPVLQIEDASVELLGAGVSYVRTFGLFGRSARFDVNVPLADGEKVKAVAKWFAGIVPKMKGFTSYGTAGIMAGAPCPPDLMERVIGEMGCTEILIAYGQCQELYGKGEAYMPVLEALEQCPEILRHSLA